MCSSWAVYSGGRSFFVTLKLGYGYKHSYEKRVLETDVPAGRYAVSDV